MGYNAGIQMHGTSKPLNSVVQTTQKNNKKKLMKDRIKKLLMNKDFLDKKTISYLEKMGYINTDI